MCTLATICIPSLCTLGKAPPLTSRMTFTDSRSRTGLFEYIKTCLTPQSFTNLHKGEGLKWPLYSARPRSEVSYFKSQLKPHTLCSVLGPLPSPQGRCFFLLCSPSFFLLKWIYCCLTGCADPVDPVLINY